MDTIVLTYCFRPTHYETIRVAFDKWQQFLPDVHFVVGYYKDRATDEFLDWANTVGHQVEFVSVHEKAYGEGYNQLIMDRQFQALLVLAPFAVPSKWLFGSMQEWLNQYSLVGHYKPPRVLIAENIYLPLVAPVIVELGRMNLDCLIVRNDFAVDFAYREFLFGTVLVRGRPGAYVLFNALQAGRAVLTLPENCRLVKYVTERDLEFKARRELDEAL